MSEELPTLKIAFLDVGQGDTIVISDPHTHEAIVVDCINANAVIQYLAQENIKNLRAVLLSHLHADHYSEADDLLQRYTLVPGMSECERLGFNQITDKNKFDILVQDKDEHSLYYERSREKSGWARSTSLRTMHRWYQEDETRFINLQAEINIKPLSWKIEGRLAERIHLIQPWAGDMPNLQAKGLNNTSVMLRVTASGSSALLTGDLEPIGWQELCKNHLSALAYLRSDVLKFPHHGGAWNAKEAESLLDVVNPSIVVMSVGSSGFEKYMHPNPEVFEVLKKRSNIHLLCTQATKQCRVEGIPPGVSTAIRTLLAEQASKNGKTLIGSKRGCPCAGTVIVEFGDSARVIQPEPSFHQRIILANFGNHQCHFSPVKAMISAGPEATPIVE